MAILYAASAHWEFHLRLLLVFGACNLVIISNRAY
jgi:hypothetical protein